MPTLEEDAPEASSATREGERGEAADVVAEAVVGRLDVVDAGVPGRVEQLGRDGEHRHVDEPGERQRDHDVEALEAEHAPALCGVGTGTRFLVSAECR